MCIAYFQWIIITMANTRQLNIEQQRNTCPSEMAYLILCDADSPSRYSASLLLRVLAVLCAVYYVLHTVLSVLLRCVWALCAAILMSAAVLCSPELRAAILSLRSVLLCRIYHSQHTVIVLLKHRTALSFRAVNYTLLLSSLLFSLCTALHCTAQRMTGLWQSPLPVSGTIPHS